MILELLAPICREKRGIHSSGCFPPEASLPVSDEGGDRLFHWSFPSLVRLSQPFTNICPFWFYLLRWDEYAPSVDLMASQINVQSLMSIIKTFVWFLLFLSCHPECNRVAFCNAPQARTIRESIHLPMQFHIFLSTILSAVAGWSHKGMSNNQDVPSECSKSGEGPPSKEKVILVLQLLVPILPVHSHRLTERISKGWDRSH